NIAGGALKSVGVSYWETNVAATNSSGFSALPSGFRSSNGSYSNAGFTGFFWTSTDYSTGSAYSRITYYNTAELRSNGNNKRSGFAVRCVQN
ncbi:MAG: FISUMP domain-containing protein, partial [Flavobacteriales bacterium]